MRSPSPPRTKMCYSTCEIPPMFAGTLACPQVSAIRGLRARAWLRAHCG
jgi:hypothetical protein